MSLTQWWTSMHGLEQWFWIIATVASLLILMYALFRVYYSGDPIPETKEERRRKQYWLLGLFVFGWSNVLISNVAANVPYGAIVMISLALAGCAVFLAAALLNDGRPPEALIESTGRVLQSIPPNQQGMGKVFLQERRQAYELDAVTVGNELPEGVPIRIVEVRKDGTVVVERIPTGPTQRPDTAL